MANHTLVTDANGIQTPSPAATQGGAVAFGNDAKLSQLVTDLRTDVTTLQHVGVSGFSGYSGAVGVSGFSGTSGRSGFSGYSGAAGNAGASGVSGFSGYSGTNGLSGFSGAVGAAGTSGFSGYSGAVGVSGVSGSVGQAGASGTSGFSGVSGFSGASGASGRSGFSGYSGANGVAGTSGFSGTNGAAGASGFSGYSGAVGVSGYSGVNGANGASGFSGQPGQDGLRGGNSLTFNFVNTTTMADPASSNFRFNGGGSYASTTAMAFSYSSAATGVSAQGWLNEMSGSSSATKGYLRIMPPGGGDYALYRVTGIIYNSSWAQLNVVWVSSANTSPTNGTTYVVDFTRTGDAGASGFSGYSGLSGYSGSAASNLVSSVNGKSGAVVLAASDVGALAPTGYFYGTLAGHGGTVDTDITITLSAYDLVPTTAASNTPTGMTLSSNGDPAWHAFSGNTWSSTSLPTTPAYIQVQFASPQIANSYQIANWQYGGGTPSTWLFQGSNNGTAWTTLDNQTAGYIAGQTITYPIGTPAAYYYYRLYLTAAQGNYNNYNVFIAQFRIFGGGSMSLYSSINDLRARVAALGG